MYLFEEFVLLLFILLELLFILKLFTMGSLSNFWKDLDKGDFVDVYFDKIKEELGLDCLFLLDVVFAYF